MPSTKERGYHPQEYYRRNAELKQALDQIAAGQFSTGDTGLFKPFVDNLLYHDPFIVLADYQAYLACAEQAAQTYRRQEAWTRMSILNTARCGFFSSDRTIGQYREDIWRVQPVKADKE